MYYFANIINTTIISFYTTIYTTIVGGCNCPNTYTFVGLTESHTICVWLRNLYMIEFLILFITEVAFGWIIRTKDEYKTYTEICGLPSFQSKIFLTQKV